VKDVGRATLDRSYSADIYRGEGDFRIESLSRSRRRDAIECRSPEQNRKNSQEVADRRISSRDEERRRKKLR
jgi:hypothetical protein